MNNDFSTYDNRVKWQRECDNAIKDKDNVILSSPTGSGKTGRYEFWALNKPERPIFITSPIKSLSNQKFRELQFAGYKVGLETGDIKYIPDDNCDIICCTQEVYNNRYRNYENSTLIIDEFSYIFEDEERARAYIDSLYYSEAKNIMICSATFGNPEEIREYIDRITDRKFFLYENKERLTTLEYKEQINKESIKDSLVVAYSKKSCEIIAKTIYRNRINQIEQLLEGNSYSNYDLKNPNRREIIELAKKYNVKNNELMELCTMGVAYYYGALYPKEKLFIEELFERKLIDTIVGTDALALGVNFPIKNVIFAELQKNNYPKPEIISKNLFEQLSGRAGRKGFFDNGYVYYCDDFTQEIFEGTNRRGKKVKLKELFFKLINSKNEKFKISLHPNIKDVLTGRTSVEDEANFIVEYSTTNKNVEEEKNKIDKIIRFIKSFDVALYYLKKMFPNFNFEQGYYKAIENCTPKFKAKFEKLSSKLMMLQPYFDKDIGEVYLTEYTMEQNCAIFVDILMETSIEDLIQKYGRDFRSLLILRQYMSKLPEKYSKCYDISVIDYAIDMLDYTVLHPTEFKIEKVVNTSKGEITPKKKVKAYKCPNYFERILIDKKEYIKILSENESMLVCDCENRNNLKLHYIPLNTNHKTLGFIKLGKRLEILNNLDFSSLSCETEEIEEKIEGMKLFLKKKHR